VYKEQHGTNKPWLALIFKKEGITWARTWLVLGTCITRLHPVGGNRPSLIGWYICIHLRRWAMFTLPVSSCSLSPALDRQSAEVNMNWGTWSESKQHYLWIPRFNHNFVSRDQYFSCYRPKLMQNMIVWRRLVSLKQCCSPEWHVPIVAVVK
jgi:hypothetical protein